LVGMVFTKTRMDNVGLVRLNGMNIRKQFRISDNGSILSQCLINSQIAPSRRMTQMKQLTLTILLILIFCMTSKGQKVEMIYNNPSDSTVDNYLIIYPKSIPWKGLLVLVPSYGEYPQNVLQQTNLPIIASRNGFLTVIPTFSNGALSFGIDSTTQSALDDLLEALSVRHKLKDAKLYLGGFSIGGSCVVKYAERANDNPKLKSQALFLQLTRRLTLNECTTQ